MEREAEERDDVTAAGLHHVLTDYKFVATMLLLCDVLPTVNRLSLIFQVQQIDSTGVPRYVQSDISKLETITSKDDNSLKSIGNYVQQLSMAGVTIRRVAKRGENLDAHEAFRKSIQLPFLGQLITNISSRFKDAVSFFHCYHCLTQKIFQMLIKL